MKSQPITVGPLVSGELKAEREATVRAEIAGAILQVYPREGESVAAGALLARIEGRPVHDAFASAQSSLRSAEQTRGVGAEGSDPHREPGQGRGARRARRRGRPQRRDPGQGRRRRCALARRLGAQVARRPDRQGADRRHRVEAARQRRRRRQPGRRALHDHRSVEHAARGLGAVGADRRDPGRRHRAPSRSAAIRNERFEGRIERVSPSADAATRQVPIFVTIPNKQRRLVAGLFAEGRIERESKTALVVPQTAVNENGSHALGAEGAGRQGAARRGHRRPARRADRAARDHARRRRRRSAAGRRGAGHDARTRRCGSRPRPTSSN